MAKENSGGSGPKTSEQQNAIRRATKARQQAVAKAAATHKAKTEVFDLQAAAKAQRSRQLYQERREYERTTQASQIYRDITSTGAIKIERWDDRAAWIGFCFEIVKLIKASGDPRLTYNREWKEEGVFRAGIIRN